MLIFPTKCSFRSTTNLNLVTCLVDIQDRRSTMVRSRVNHMYGSSHSRSTCFQGGRLMPKTKYAKEGRHRFLNVINEERRANRVNVNEISSSCFKNSRESENHNIDADDDASILGTLMKDDEGSFYRQPFVIRCYEIGRTNLQQWKRLLVCCRGNKVEVDAWSALQNNSLREDWIVRDYRNKQVIAKATSKWMLMKMETQKISKMPEEVRREWAVIDSSRYAFESQVDDDHHNGIEKSSMPTDGTADSIVSGFTPRWQDMDDNMHVSYTKYIRWIMESVPMGVTRSHLITSITVEYRRECRQDDVLECLTSVKPLTKSNGSMDITRAIDIESTHLLRRQIDKADIVRAKITWLSKTKELNTKKSVAQEIHDRHE